MCTEDSPSGLWRTLGKRVGCKPSGVRIPHPPPPDPGTASGSGVFVTCGAAGVPGAVGPGRCVCRWAAARPRAVRAASFARRVASKPGQAPPPPTGTAARPSGALHTSVACDAVCGGASFRFPARQRRRLSEPRQLLGGQSRGDELCLFAAARAGQKRVCWGPVLRVTVSSEPPQGRNAARIRVRCRVRGGSLYMLLDLGRLQDAFLRCGSGHSS